MSYSSEVLSDAPIAYWRLGEASGTTAADASGNGRSATYAGGVTLGAAGLLVGDADTSVNFNGSTGSAGAASAAWMNVTALTVEAVIRPDAVNSVRMIADRDTGSAHRAFQFRINSGKLDAIAWNDSGTLYTKTGATTLVAGTTYHVAMTWDGATLKVYVNGVLDGSVAVTGSMRGVTSALTIGAGTAGNAAGFLTAFYAGRIDEVAYYSTALSAARIAAHSDAAQGVVSASTSTVAATRIARIATFTSATVLASTMSATALPHVAAFASEAVVETARTSSIETTRTARAASFTSEAVAELAGRLSQVVATRASQIATFVSRATIPVTPAPDVVTQSMSVVVAQAHGAVTMSGTQPVYTVSEAAIARGRQQIIVNGVDVTYFRDVVTPDVDYTLLEPLLYGPGTVEFPQIAACFETEGVGDLSWLRAQAPVEVNLVVDDVVVAPLYKGFVAAFDKSGRALTVELGGEANGRAAMRDRQVPIFPRINDVGHQLADAVRDLGLPHYPPLGAVTGIELMTTGGTGHLDHINDLVAKSWTRSGKQWTVMPDPATGVYETHRKDATTIHASAFIDDALTVAKLRRDIAEEPNQIFVTCVTPAGMRVRFGKYPGLVQGPVPDFPGVMSLGSTGEGVRLLVGKLHASGYLRLAEVAGGFDDDVERAVIQLQDDAGLPETGEVNLATWRALYDLDVTGLSLEWANIQPAAQRSKTRKFDRSANGTIMGFNDEYDPDVIVRHRSIDLGSGVTRKQAREYARTVLHDSDDANWVGDITFNAGALIRGEATVGMALTAANVMDARELRPGMNLWLPAFDGGTLLHVSACQADRDGIVTATVDTRFRDAMEVWEVIARNKESRNDPSRQRERRHRSSTIAKDSIGEWDEFGGFLGVDLPLERGWTVFPVVAAMEGQIHKLKVELATPGEFAVAVFGKKVDAGWLDDLIPHPLTVSGTKKWETERNALDDNWLLYSAGTHDEPGGYWPGRKKWKSVTGEEANPDYDPAADTNDTGTDDQETVEVTTSESTGTLTGKHVDDAGFRYAAFDRKVVWVAVWVRGANKIETGRIMWPQLEAGV